MATKIGGKFQQKIGQYSACVRDITKILAPNTYREFELKQQQKVNETISNKAERSLKLTSTAKMVKNTNAL